MSWWETGPRRLLIGDLPADKVEAALKQISTPAASGPRSRPTLPSLLAAVQAVLLRRDATLRGVRALTTEGDVMPADAADPWLIGVFEQAFEEAARTYLEAVERGPSSDELLAVTQFALGSRPVSILSGIGDRRILEIAADRDDDAAQATQGRSS